MTTPQHPDQPGEQPQDSAPQGPPQFEKPSAQQPGYGQPAPQPGDGQPPAGYGYGQPQPEPPQAGYAPPPTGYQQPPAGYGYQQPPTGYGPPPTGYQQPPAGYGYQQPPAGYAPPPTGYQQPPAGYGPPQPGYGPPPTYAQPPYAQPPAYAYGPLFELSGWWRRVGARIVDGLIIAVFAMLLGTLIASLAGLDLGDFSTTGGSLIDQIEAAEARGEQWDPELSDFTGDGWTWLLVCWITSVVVAAGYGALFLTFWHGRTPGKKLAGIRVVNEQGAPPSAGTAWLREFVVKQVLVAWIGGFFLLGLPGLINYLWPLWDPQNRAGHDFIAKTRVIRDHGEPAGPPAGPPTHDFLGKH